MDNFNIDVKKMFNLDNINLDLSRDLNIAAQTVVQDIRNANRKGLTIQYKPIQPLKEKTIQLKLKKRSKSPGRALYDTGRMIGAGSAKGVGGRGPYLKQKATPTKQVAIVSPSEDRIEIGGLHQVGSKKRNLPARPWFGVSTVAEKRIEFAFKSKLAEIIKNA